MRPLVLLFLLAGAAPAPELRPQLVEAVEFPYYAYPPQLWERELVWLKNLGIDTVAFSIPWNWHQLDAETLDLTGRTSPRRDLIGFIRLVKRAGLRAWIRPAPPVKGWIDSGYPKGTESDRSRAAQMAVGSRNGARSVSCIARRTHRFRRGTGRRFPRSAAATRRSPACPRRIRARSSGAVKLLAAGHGSLVWEDIEDQLPPVGWEAPGGALIRPGAVSLAGDERTSVMPLRRDALLWRYWSAALPAMKAAPQVRLLAGKLPAGMLAHQLMASRGASAVNVVNQSHASFQGALRVFYPPTEKRIELPSIYLAPGEALCLPVHIPLASDGFCQDCSGFGNGDHIVYATAELNDVEYENGILAMEFAAPRAGEVVLQLSQEPSGPLLAAGPSHEFRLGRAHHARAVTRSGRQRPGLSGAYRTGHSAAGHVGVFWRCETAGHRAKESSGDVLFVRAGGAALTPEDSAEPSRREAP